MEIPYLYGYPTWVATAFFVLVFLVALELGFRLGDRRRRRDPEAAAAAATFGMASKSLSALLTLLLAFTFGFVVSRHQSRKATLVEDANAIGTAFHQADLVQGAEERQVLRQALFDYAATRVVSEEDRAQRTPLKKLVQRTERAQERIWPATRSVVENGDRDPLDAALVSSIAKVLDSHTSRRAATLDRIPVTVFRMLVALAALWFFLAGFNSGLEGRFARLQISVLVLVMGFVLTVMIDFDRPYDGMIRLSQDALSETIRQMEHSLNRR